MITTCTIYLPMTIRPAWRRFGAAAVTSIIALLGAGLVTPIHAGPVVDCTTDCFVDTVSGDDTLNHGTSTSDAFKTIQKASTP
jgi:hypothetical protein